MAKNFITFFRNRYIIRYSPGSFDCIIVSAYRHMHFVSGNRASVQFYAWYVAFVITRFIRNPAAE